MRNKIILEFADWYINNIEGKSSSYFSNYFQSNRELFIIKLTEYGVAFEQAYSFNPFDAEFSDEFISKIYTALKSNHQESFKEYNAKNQNGGPRALLGKRNYLRFLNEKIIEDNFSKERKNTLNNSFYLRKEFVLWLVNENGFTLGSAKSYSSYVSSANRLLQEDFFNLIKTSIENKEYIVTNDLIDECIVAINTSLQDKANKSKLKNGLIKYKEFLLEDKELFEDEETIIPPKKTITKKTKVNKAKSDVFYKDDLIKNFQFRITTQDRIYGNVFFPISFLKKLFYYNDERDFFDKWTKNQIENIKLHISNDKYVLLKKVEKLEFENNKVYISYGSKKDELLSEVIDSDIKMPIERNSLRNVVIDHIVPMKKILSSNRFEGLSFITDKIRSCEHFSKKLSGKDLLKNVKEVGNRLLEEDLFLVDKLEYLKKDLELISGRENLQLMDAIQNLNKNKKLN